MSVCMSFQVLTQLAGGCTNYSRKGMKGSGGRAVTNHLSDLLVLGG